jgi:hypothetical protein
VSASAAALLALVLLGPAPADDPPPPDPIARAAYLMAIRPHLGPAHAGSTDDALVAVGQSICAALDSGVSLLDTATIAMAHGLSPDEAGTISGAAVAGLCPRHDSLIPGLGQ